MLRVSDIRLKWLDWNGVLDGSGMMVRLKGRNSMGVKVHNNKRVDFRMKHIFRNRWRKYMNISLLSKLLFFTVRFERKEVKKIVCLPIYYIDTTCNIFLYV